MHANRLLHNLLDDACVSIDKRIRKSLFLAAGTLAHCKQLALVALGRSLDQPAKVKHNIKRMDRLFGNIGLHAHRSTIYSGMNQFLLKNNPRPVIVVDWSGLTRCGAYHFLRAATTVNGRTITLYDQAYPLKDYGKEAVHKNFLRALKDILPINCKPIILTDAGFRNTWFLAVKALGWDFLGRVRNKTHYSKVGSDLWRPIKTLYDKAKYKATCFGRVLLARSRPVLCDLYLVKQKKKYRVKRNLIGKKVQCSSSKKHEIRENEPWLIATSLSSEEVSAADVMRLYKKRMQIEEAFRDLKNNRNGFSLRQCRSFRVDRLNIALLIATLATLVLWLIGLAAKQQNLHYSYQTNTEKNTRVLSDVFIGWQALRRQDVKLTKSNLATALQALVNATVWRAAA